MIKNTRYRFNASHRVALIVLLGITCFNLHAKKFNNIEIDEALERCYIEQIQLSDEERLIGEVQKWCNEQYEQSKTDTKIKLTPLEKRLLREKANRDNPNVITSHKRNYLLPVSFVNKPNNAPYDNFSEENQLDRFEAKFQLSFKAPITESIFKDEDMLFFGFTIQSYWQMYNSELSSPFRETNYQPEIFYGIFNDFKFGEWTNRVNVIGIEHQSNGRPQPLSRSWNRIYANFVWENDNWVVMFKPWYRLPETEKTEINQPDGDDNPDISHYMGHFEFSSVYKWDSQTFGMMVRNNFSKNNRGALQLDWTFPLGTRFKGYAQYFNGYGESMIDYNHSIQRLGIGILLTDIF